MGAALVGPILGIVVFSHKLLGLSNRLFVVPIASNAGGIVQREDSKATAIRSVSTRSSLEPFYTLEYACGAVEEELGPILPRGGS